jgi:nitrite reductase (cytochrome c-552)
LYDKVKAASSAEATPARLALALALQRKGKLRADFVKAENSGFLAPREAARILGDAIDYARQGELAAARARSAN